MALLSNALESLLLSTARLKDLIKVSWDGREKSASHKLVGCAHQQATYSLQYWLFLFFYPPTFASMTKVSFLHSLTKALLFSKYTAVHVTGSINHAHQHDWLSRPVQCFTRITQ